MSSAPMPGKRTRLAAAVVAGAMLMPRPGGAWEVRRVGVGAATCGRDMAEIDERPGAERDHVAWTQGFMSGLLQRVPPGRDKGLDLLPLGFPLQRQAEFLRTWCRSNAGGDFSDAAAELYRALRAPPS